MVEGTQARGVAGSHTITLRSEVAQRGVEVPHSVGIAGVLPAPRCLLLGTVGEDGSDVTDHPPRHEVHGRLVSVVLQLWFRLI